MCDVERPMGIFGTLFNKVYKLAMRAMIVPNTEEDKKGLGSRIFIKLTNFLGYSKKLKKRNRPLYKVVKFATVITEQMKREFAISEAANVAFNISQETGEQARKGNQVLDSTVKAMNELTKQIVVMAS